MASTGVTRRLRLKGEVPVGVPVRPRTSKTP